MLFARSYSALFQMLSNQTSVEYYVNRQVHDLQWKLAVRIETKKREVSKGHNPTVNSRIVGREEELNTKKKERLM